MIKIIIGVMILFVMFGCVDESKKKCDQSMTKIQAEEENLIFYNKYESYELALKSTGKMIALSKELAVNCKDVPNSKSQEEIKKSIQTYISLKKQFKQKVDAIKKLEKLEQVKIDRLPAETKKHKSMRRSSIVSPKQTRLKAKRDVIMDNCRAKWGTNYRMIKYCRNTQTEAKYFVDAQYNDIIKKQCTRKWGDNYRMIKYCIDTQRSAKKDLGL
jgi:hypothetical protein